jgi:2-iminobutanoate/2-iminopropanoate deaminase
MFVVTEPDAAAIRAAFERSGELSAAVEHCAGSSLVSPTTRRHGCAPAPSPTGSRGQQRCRCAGPSPIGAFTFTKGGERKMQRREVNAPEAPPVASYYSQAIEVSGVTRTLYISGQVGVDATGKNAADFAAQCRQALLNLQAQLRAADMSFNNVVKLFTILPDLANIGELRRVRAEIMGDRKPGFCHASRRRCWQCVVRFPWIAAGWGRRGRFRWIAWAVAQGQ